MQLPQLPEALGICVRQANSFAGIDKMWYNCGIRNPFFTSEVGRQVRQGRRNGHAIADHLGLTIE